MQPATLALPTILLLLSGILFWRSILSGQPYQATRQASGWWSVNGDPAEQRNATAISSGVPEHTTVVIFTPSLEQGASGHGQLYEKVQKLVNAWTPPSLTGHWPPYDAYVVKDYDPNLWESFPWNVAYYVNNGITQLKNHPPAKLRPPNSYPPYDSAEYMKM